MVISVNNLVDQKANRPHKIKAKSWLAVMTAVVTTLSTSILPAAFNPAAANARTTVSTRSVADFWINKNKSLPKLARGNGQMQVVYRDSSSEVGQIIVKSAQEQKLLELFSALITSKVGLPRDVTVFMQDCGVVNAFYNPDQHSITMCTELTTSLIQQFLQAGFEPEKAIELAVYTTVFVFFHEAGHMLVSELELPITGREEDVADQFAANVFLNWFGNDPSSAAFGQQIVASAAQWFALSKDNLESTLTFMDEHSLNQQRFLSLLCMLYVKNPDEYARLVVNAGFDTRRLSLCRRELQQIATSWDALLAPHAVN
jgi:hypothetical protein